MRRRRRSRQILRLHQVDHDAASSQRRLLNRTAARRRVIESTCDGLYVDLILVQKKKKKKYRQDNKKILLFVLYLSLDTSSIREFLLFGILGHIFLTRSEDRTPELHCCTCRLIGGPKENSKGRIESSCRPDFGGPWTKIFPRAGSVRLLLNVKKIIFFILMEQREK